jgi:hypothetical protein
MRFLLVPAPSEFTICRNRQSSRNREQHAISVQFTSPGLAELLSVFCVDAMLCEEFTGSAATEHARLRPRIARPDASTDKHRNDLGEEDLCAARDANQALRSTVRNGTASIFGRRKGSDLTYAGKVDYGFDKKSSAELRKRLTPLIRKTNPTPSGSRTRAFGLSRSCPPRSSTARSLPRERCAIPFL